MLGTKAKAARINLTKDAIERLQPPAAGRTYTYDAKVGGLAVCTTAAGTKTFYLYKKVNGKPERMRLGPWPDLTVDQARRLAQSHNGAIAEGKNPAVKLRVVRQAPTLGDVFDLFIELPTRTKAKRPKSPVTITGYRQAFTLLDGWKARKLSSITKADIEALHNRLGQEHGPYMANRVLELLRALFNCAIDLELYNANPAARLRGFEEQSRERFLHAEELPRFFAAVEAEPSDKVRDFIWLALFTGQRRMKVLSMRWVDVDLQAFIWAPPSGSPNKRAATVPLVQPAIDVLQRRYAARGDSEYVLPGRHGKGHLQDVMRQWREILKRAGIDDLRLHDLRRSCGSWQAITGASLPVIGKSLGHTRPETTQIYARLQTDTVRTAMETATSAILAASKPKRGRKGASNAT